MARPIRKNASYFSHDADASSDIKLIFLEQKYAAIAYAWYFKMLEELTKTDGHIIHLTDFIIPVLSKKFGIELSLFNQILDDAVNVGLLVKEEDALYSEGLLKRLQPVYDKRERQRKWSSGGFSTTETPTNSVENSQRKEKETKGKKTKEKNIETPLEKPSITNNKPTLQEVISEVTKQLDFNPDLTVEQRNERLNSAERFWSYYEAQNWETSGLNRKPITNWVAKLQQWLLNNNQFENKLTNNNNGNNKKNADRRASNIPDTERPSGWMDRERNKVFPNVVNIGSK